MLVKIFCGKLRKIKCYGKVRKNIKNMPMLTRRTGTNITKNLKTEIRTRQNPIINEKKTGGCNRKLPKYIHSPSFRQ